MLLVTSLGKAQYQSLGEPMVKTLRKHSKLPLRVYSEDEITFPNEEVIPLQAVEGWQEFYDHTEAFEPTAYLWDARRFCHKIYAMLDAFESEHRYVVWLDIDLEFKKDFGENFFKKLVKGHAVAYLGRGQTYTETGCVIFDTEHEDFPEFKKRIREAYDQRFIFAMPIYIDCVVIDAAMTGLEVRNLTPDVTGMVDVFSQSPLDEIMTHNKGQGHGQYRRAG